MSWNDLGAVVAAALLAGMILVIEHIAIRLWDVRLHYIPRYILGTLAILGPFSGLAMFWQDWRALAAIWAITVAGGATVVGLYAAGMRWPTTDTKLAESQDRERLLDEQARAQNGG